MTDPLLEAWNGALPPVLALMGDPQRGMFRQELQRFLATARFDPAAASAMASPLTELLLQAARAARRPAAIQALREPSACDRLVPLCEHLLACWRDAEEAAAEATDPVAGADGIFFGPRLGGPGRPGAVQRGDPDEP